MFQRLSATNKCGSGDVTSGSSTSSFVSTKDEGEVSLKKYSNFKDNLVNNSLT